MAKRRDRRGLSLQKREELISRLGSLEKLENPPDFSDVEDIVNRLNERVGYKLPPIPVIRKQVKQALPEFKRRRLEAMVQSEEEEIHSKRRKCNSSEEAAELQRIGDVPLKASPSSTSSSDDYDSMAKNLEIENPGSGSEWNRAESSVSRDVEVNKGMEGGPKFSDLGGMQKLLQQLTNEIITPLQAGWLPQWLKIKPMSGILLSGPPGCGKTTLALAIANETGLPFYDISHASVSEESLREVFSKAYKNSPSIVFIDEIDAFGSKRDNMQRESDKQRVVQLITCMNESSPRRVHPADTTSGSHTSAYVLVIGATNRPYALDPALRRRFGTEIILDVPDENARLAILSVITSKLRVEGSLNLLKLARSTSGYVGSDLQDLSNRAGMIAMTRIFQEFRDRNQDFHKPPEDMEKFAITMSDFEEALLVVQPSLKREGFSAVPNVKWEDVGGLDLLRKRFERYIVKLIKEPESYKKFNVKSETGILLYGPPGCGKTLIAKAVASESGASFIYIKGPELLDKFVGESEKAVRKLFSDARKSAPCIIFFDEVDSLTTRRGTEEGRNLQGLLDQLLVELDGADQRQGVFVIGATNRPDVMEPALLRPGRFSKHIYVSPPSTEERGLILKAIARKYPVDASVDLGEIGKWEACENFSGADLAELINEAAICARDETETLMERSDTFAGTIKETHFQLAVAEIVPSVTKTQLQIYQKFGQRSKK